MPQDHHEAQDRHAETSGGAGEPEGRPPQAAPAEPDVSDARPKRRRAKRRGKRLTKEPGSARPTYTGEERLLILDVWKRSALPATDFGDLVQVSASSLYKWDKIFEAEGPEGLMDPPRTRVRASTLPEVTRRTILMLKDSHPDWGLQRISDTLARSEGLGASPSAVRKVLADAGYELEEHATRPHVAKVTRFERGRPNEMWQTDLFTFMLKRQNRRVYLVVFLDDHSRFIVSHGLHASQSTSLVLETFRSGIASYGPPREVLTDNGSQYVTWRGKSAFAKECEAKGIEHIVARPRHPQTLGKTERFWSTLWKELLEGAVFVDLADAQRRIALFIDYYNFQRTHQGIDGLYPADRFFHAAEDVKRSIQSRIAANAFEIARNGQPKEPFYMTGKVGGQTFSVHGEGERVILREEDGDRREVDLVRPVRAVRPDEPDAAERDTAERGDHPESAGHPERPVVPPAYSRDGSPISADDRVPEPEPEPGTSFLDRLGHLWKEAKVDPETHDDGPDDVDHLEDAPTPKDVGESLARRRGVVILEVLAGLRGSSEAAQELGIALQGYYVLEERAVKGLVAACEPRPPGPKRNYRREAEELRDENERLRAENARYQALVRTSQLSVGMDPDKKPKENGNGKKKRNRRPTIRALRAIDQLESKPKPQ